MRIPPRRNRLRIADLCRATLSLNLPSVEGRTLAAFLDAASLAPFGQGAFEAEPHGAPASR
jgi:hypothetical protein